MFNKKPDDLDGSFWNLLGDGYEVRITETDWEGEPGTDIVKVRVSKGGKAHVFQDYVWHASKFDGFFDFVARFAKEKFENDERD